MKTSDLLNETEQQTHPAMEEPGMQSSGHAPLFNTNESEDMRRRWQQIQGNFVDEPRKAVEGADDLVAQAIKRLAEMFADERSKLEADWSRGEEVSTEDLRQALRRYRSFFDRLLTI
jgi:hypothetical protein